MKRLIYGAALALGLAGAAAAEYPEREIQGVIQWGAGGATDTVSRAMQARAEETLGERIVMTNRTGGTGLLATRFVMSRPDDGYTLLFGSDSPLSYQVLGLADLDYSDFYPVAIPGQALVVVMVPADSPYQTLEDLVAAVREQVGLGSTFYGHHVVWPIVDPYIVVAVYGEAGDAAKFPEIW